MTATIAKDDLDEVTEIIELDVSKVSSVGSPANGTPWLLMKSAAGGLESDDGTPFLLLKSRRDDRVPDVIRVGDIGGPGLRPDEPGPRAEKIDRVIVGGASAIDVMLEDADSIEAMLDLRPDPEPAHDSIVPKIVGAASATLKLEKELAAAADPVERERLAEQITLAKLKALHNGAAVKSNLGGNVMSKVVTDNDLQRFRKELAAMPAGPEKSEAAARVTHLALLKSAYSEQIERTNAAIRLAQDSATRPASLGQPSGAAQRSQVALEGEPQSLGGVSPLGNRGDFTGDYIGRMEREPAAVEGEIRDELAKSTDPSARAELSQRLTYARLRRSHEPAHSTRVAKGKGGKAGQSQVMKATRLAARRALR